MSISQSSNRASQQATAADTFTAEVRIKRFVEKVWFFLALAGWTAAIAMGIMLWLSWKDNESYYDTAHGVFEKFHSGNETQDKKIAIINLRGVILDGQTVIDQLKRAESDSAICAIVLRVESPGGTVYGSDLIYHRLCEFRDETKLPIVVSMGSIAASGGYYASMCVGDQMEAIFAEPSTITGSIGVVLPHYDVTGLLSRWDVRDDSIKSHPNKQMLSMTHRMTDTQREIVQAQIDSSFERFKSKILEGRPVYRGMNQDLQPGDPIQIMSPGTGQNLATGEVFTTSQAIAAGLVDREGFLEDAIDRAAELAGETIDSVKVIEYGRPQPLFDIQNLIGLRDEQALVTLLTRPGHPQAWYLAGHAPPFMPLPNEYQATPSN